MERDIKCARSLVEGQDQHEPNRLKAERVSRLKKLEAGLADKSRLKKLKAEFADKSRLKKPKVKLA